MNLKIGDKEYELNFGVGFLRDLDKYRAAEADGMKMGMGFQLVLGPLLSGDPLAMYDVIKAATADCPQKPSNADVEEFIGNCDQEELIGDFLESLKTSNLTKQPVRMLINSLPKEKLPDQAKK